MRQRGLEGPPGPEGLRVRRLDRETKEKKNILNRGRKVPKEDIKSQKKESSLKHPVPSKHLEKIGDITVSFALLEIYIKSFIESLLGFHQRISQIITAELSFRNLRALLISLYKERYGEDNNFKIARDLMNRAGKIEEARNQIAHSFWGAGKDVYSITRIKTTAKEKYGLQFKFENIKVNDLAKIADDIKKLASEIMDFNFALMGIK